MKIFGYEITKSKTPQSPQTEALAVEPVAVAPAVVQDEGDTAMEGFAKFSPEDIDLAAKVMANLAAQASGTKLAEVDKATLPTKGGRSSIPSEALGFGALMSEFNTVTHDFPVAVYNVLENLATYNADVSYALDNIVQLGNTNFNIAFDENVPEEQQKDMRKYLKRRMKHWYRYGAGANGLVTDLLAQIALGGALSAEQVPMDDLSGIKKVVLVNTKSIRFRYDEATDEYMPYQTVNNGLFGNLKDSSLGLHPLNLETYKYTALRRFNDKPYAIPPFLSAFEHICIERDMWKNVKGVIKKLGILGFLQVLMTAPKPQQNEAPEAYEARMGRYITSMLPEIEKGFNNGVVMGFKGTHEFQVQNTATNITGAKDLIELNSQVKMSGLKQDPLMLGRNYSTTETLARVILAKLTTQVGNYQKIVAGFLEQVILTDLLLAGFAVEYVEVEFDAPMVGDKLREEQAYEKRIKNYNDLYNQGVVSQVQRAQALGFDEPDEEEPRNQFTDSEGNPLDPKYRTDDPDNETETGDAADPKTTAANGKQLTAALRTVELSLRGTAPTFVYELDGVNCTCDHHRHEESFDLDDELNDFANGYEKSVGASYDEAVKKALKQIAKGMAELGAGASVQQVTDKIMYILFKNWPKLFTKAIKKKTESWVSKIYRKFRDDKSIFGTYSGVIPKSTLSLPDYRTMQYWAKSDQFYLGRFITDPDTKNRVYEFIKQKHINEQLPIGDKTGEMIAAFREEFGDLLLGEDWKITRVINTTANKMRNYANVAYLDQAGIERFVVRGVNDRLQCKYCSYMQGKSFSVSTAVNKINQINHGDELSIKTQSPFITSVYKNPEDMKELTADQLQAAGIDTPPYHPGCRDRLVADI